MPRIEEPADKKSDSMCDDVQDKRANKFAHLVDDILATSGNALEGSSIIFCTYMIA